MQLDRPLKWSLALATLCLALSISGCGDNPKNQSQTKTPLIEVGVVTVKPQAVTLTTELAGRTTPFLIAEVRPQVGGIIQKRLFQEGGEIKAGQILYQIDSARYQAAHDSAKAALAKDEATLAAARLRFDRYKELVTIKAVSKEAYDNAEAALKQGLAQIALDKAALDLARINLDYTRVVSPISGRIGRSNVTPGALVTADQTKPLATVQQLDPIYVDVTQSSADMLRLKHQLDNGQLKRPEEIEAKVRLILEDGTTYPKNGRLQFSEVSVDEQTGTVTLRAVFPNPRQDLLPGMYVRALIQEGVTKAILAPQQSVTRDSQGKATALVLNPEGKVEQRRIEVERAMGDKWLVSKGLEDGDILIVEGLQKVRPGASARGIPLETKPESGTLAQNETLEDKK